jgi:hypothetical protein
MSKLPGFLLATACATGALAQTGSPLSANGPATADDAAPGASLANPGAERSRPASDAMGSRQSADARQVASASRQLAAGDRLDRFFVDEDREHRPLDPEQRLASPDKDRHAAPAHRARPKRQQ